MAAQLSALLASIPSPSSNSINIGPLRFTAYGLMIAFGVIAGTDLARRRWVRRGGRHDDMSSIMLWAIPAGLIGARAYHVLTDWRRFEGRWDDVYKVWQGGLGIPGGMFLGILVGMAVAKRRGMRVPDALDAAVPGAPLAQAFGRLGNWWNQELYGRPTDLPWGLEIDERHRSERYADVATFHPTFLYELLWNLGLMAALLVIDRLGWVRRGRLIGVYMLGYGLGRLWIEALRIDTATLLFGARVNIWMSSALILGGLVVIFAGGRDSGDSGEAIEDGTAQRRPKGKRPIAEVPVGKNRKS